MMFLHEQLWFSLVNVFIAGIWSPTRSVTQQGNMRIIILGTEKYSTKGKGYADRERYTNSQLHEKKV